MRYIQSVHKNMEYFSRVDSKYQNDEKNSYVHISDKFN